MTQKAIIYARVSSVGDRQSTARQVADLKEFARRNDIEIVGSFDEHCSGAAEERPVLLHCMQLLKRGECKTLLVTEISRLGRTVKSVINTVDELTKIGVSVYILDINLWTLLPNGFENPIAKIILTTMSLAAEMERKAIVGRLNSGRKQAIEKGVRMGRPAGTKLSDQELLKKYPEVVKYLKKGYSLVAIERLCSISHTTVQKVKNTMKRQK